MCYSILFYQSLFRLTRDIATTKIKLLYNRFLIRFVPSSQGDPLCQR